MSNWSRFKEAVSGLADKAAELVDKAVDVAEGALLRAAEVTLDTCSYIAEKTEEAFHWVGSKIDEYSTKIKNYMIDKNVPEDVKHTHKPHAEKGVGLINKQFPEGFKQAINKHNPEERKQKIADLAENVTSLMKIKNPPEIIFFNPTKGVDEYECGRYDHENNRLEINLAMTISAEPKILLEQVCTIFHELVHANQLRAIDAYNAGKSVIEFGYTKDYVKLLDYNLDHYIDPRENFEAYTQQPLEAEAFYIEHLLKSLLAKKQEL